MLRLARLVALAGLLGAVSGCAGRSRPLPSPAQARPAPATVVFRLSVDVDGATHPFPPSRIHLVRTDLVPGVPPAGGLPEPNPAVRALGDPGEGWYAADLPPGRYHLNAIRFWHFPTPRGVPPLLLEIEPGDDLVYAGSVSWTCRDRLPDELPGSARFDCEPPRIETGEAGQAARAAGRTGTPAVRAARPLTDLTRPPGPWPAGRWALESEAEAGLPLRPFPDVHGAKVSSAVAGGAAVISSLACGPLFPFCLAITVPAVAVGSAVEVGHERHGNEVRAACNDRILPQLTAFGPGLRLRDALRRELAAAGRPLADGPDPPAVLLRARILRLGVRGDACMPAANPFTLRDRYRADLLAGIQAVDGRTGAVLYEEFLLNTGKLSALDVLAGRGSLTPVGTAPECRKIRAFCPEEGEGEGALPADLEPAFEAFARHVAEVLSGS